MSPFIVFLYSVSCLANSSIGKSKFHVIGWVKRVPMGIIGPNRTDLANVVDLIINTLKGSKNTVGIIELLKLGINYRLGWLGKINAQGVIFGELVEKLRKKEAVWKRLIDLGTTL